MARVMVFVDGSYFETQMRRLDPSIRWDIDRLGPSLIAATGLRAATFEWLHYYGSYAPPRRRAGRQGTAALGRRRWSSWNGSRIPAG